MSEPHNPYAAPQSLVVPSHFTDFTQDGPPSPWATGEVLSESWALFKQHWAPLVGGLIVGYAVVFGVQMVFSALAAMLGSGSNNAGVAIITALVSAVLSTVVQAAVTCGWARLYLMAVRGETPVFGVLFSSFPLFPQMLVASLLWTLGYILGSVLLIVPGVIFGLGTIFYMYFVADGESGTDSLRSSWTATHGHKLDLFVFGLAVFGINIVGMLACGVGMLVTLPVTMLAMAVIYTRITGRFGSRGWATV